MLRLIVSLCAFTCVSFNLFSQSIDSLINIKGYYVTRFIKEEMSFSYDQKINKLRGESYSTPIDYKKTSFFIPTFIDNQHINQNIIEIISIENNLHKDSIYYLPVSKQNEKYAKKAFNLDTDLSREICILSEVNKFSPYYTSFDNDKFIYKCILIDGYALKKVLINTEENRFPFHLDVYSVNNNSPFVELFFITTVRLNFNRTHFIA